MADILDTLKEWMPVVSTVSSIGTSVANAIGQNQAISDNLAENKKNRDFNAEQAQLAFDRNTAFTREMWDKQSVYNTPKEQIKRLIDAGVNPSNFGNVNTASSPVSTSSPSAQHSGSIPSQPVHYDNPLLMDAQIRNLNAQSDKLNSDTDLNKANKQRLQELLSGEKELQRLEIVGKQFDVDELKPAQVDNLIAQTNTFNSNARNLDENTKKIQQEIANLLEQQHLILEQVRRAKIENEFLPDILYSEIKKNLSEVTRNKEQAHLLAQEATNAILEGGSLALSFEEDEKSHSDKIEISKSDNEWTKLKNHWRGKYPRMSYAIETGSAIIGGISRGVVSSVGRIGSAIISGGK